MEDNNTDSEFKNFAKDLMEPGSLNGLWFHSRDENKGPVSWQGQVVRTISEQICAVQLYDWLLGDPTVIRLVRIKDMLHWTFYDSNEYMNECYRMYELDRGKA